MRSKVLGRVVGASLLALTVAMATPGAAQPAPSIAPADAVARLFTGPSVDEAWFDPLFLAQVPVPLIMQIRAQLTNQFGAFLGVEPEGSGYVTRFERADVPTEVGLDAEGQIAGLFFGQPVPVGGDVESYIAEIAGFPGETSVIVLTNGELAAGHRPEAVMAVGSAFKLAILAALAEDTAPGSLINLDDVVYLEEAWRSLPSGFLHTWPVGTPVTVATLANLMISISDNTATDALIALLGRDRISRLTERNTPLLTTAELFKLHAIGNEAFLQRWIDGDAAARQVVLDELATLPLPAVNQLSSGVALEAEWHFNAFEICALLERTQDMPAFDINPGLASAADWASVAFKGGSENGVLNLSTHVVAADGTTHCVVASWNDTNLLDDQALYSSYSGILATLAAGHAD